VVFVFVVPFSVYSTVMHRCLYYLLYSCLIMLCHIYVDEINNNNNMLTPNGPRKQENKPEDQFKK